MRWEINEDCQIKGLADIYKKYLGDYGYLVEVGAFDGVTHSNSLPLIKAGWGALMVEPVTENYNQLVANLADYPWVTKRQVAIGRTADDVIISRRGEWSSIMMNDIIDEMPSSTAIEEYEQIKQIPLSKLCETEGITSYDLLIIDCEGHDYQALASANVEKYKPTMIIIELHEKSELWTDHPEVRSIIKGTYNLLYKHYKPIYVDEINTIFVRNEL